MPLIVTPRQFKQRAQFYHQLGQLASAGVPMLKALDMLSRNPPARSFREPIKEMIVEITQGATVADALQHIGRWVPSFDIALVRAAEQSGRLDAVFKLLATYYDERAALLRQVISDLLYPVFVFHMAIFVFPFVDWFAHSPSLFSLFMRTFGILIPIYGGIFLMIYASQGRRGAKWRSIFERITKFVPLLGAARRDLALARLAASLEALINAGMTIIEAWEMAAAASGSPALYETVAAWKPQLVAGQTPAEAVTAAPSQFPEMFANLYSSGEISGQLDESLRRLHAYYQEEGTTKLRILSKWVPQFIYLCVAGLVAFKVISFYTGYFKEINNAIDMK